MKMINLKKNMQRAAGTRLLSSCSWRCFRKLCDGSRGKLRRSNAQKIARYTVHTRPVILRPATSKI